MKITPKTEAEVRETVREHYASLARTGNTCCGPAEAGAGDCCSNAALYPADLITSVPADVSSFSLGCGDPVSPAALRPGQVVVDLGSGGGLDCFVAARQVGPTGRVIGVDMTPDMLARARANAARLNVTNVEFREGYIEALPVADGEADVIISNCVVNLSPDKPRVLAEMFRALRSGGRIAISDVVTQGALPEAVQADAEAWSACVAGALDVADWQAGLAAVGFEDVAVEPKAEFSAGLDHLPAHTPFSAIITARKP